MLLRVLGIGLLVIVAIPLVIAFPPLALLGLGGWFLLSRRPGRSTRRRRGHSKQRPRSPHRARRRMGVAGDLRLGRPLLWMVGIVGLLAVGGTLVREAPGVLAALGLLGLVFLLRKQKRGQTKGSVVTGGTLWDGLQPGHGVSARSGTEFERHVVALLKSLNYRNVQHVGGPGDRGVDIIARDNRGRTFLVQCKRFTSGAKVGSVDVQKLIGAVVHQGADGGIFVTTSSYTPAAIALAESGRVQIALFDGKDVARLSRRLGW